MGAFERPQRQNTPAYPSGSYATTATRSRARGRRAESMTTVGRCPTPRTRRRGGSGVVPGGLRPCPAPTRGRLCRSCRVKGSASPSPTPGSSLRSDCGLWSALDPPSAKHHAKRLKTAYSAFSRPNPARMYPEARKTAPRASCGRSCASLPLLFHCQAIAGCLRAVQAAQGGAATGGRGGTPHVEERPRRGL